MQLSLQTLGLGLCSKAVGSGQVRIEKLRDVWWVSIGTLFFFVVCLLFFFHLAQVDMNVAVP